MLPRQNNLTFSSLSGFLFPLLPYSSMPSPETLRSSLESNTSQPSNSLLQRISSLAGSSKARVFAALAAGALAVENSNKAEAALVVPAEVTRNGDGLPRLPDDAAILDITQLTLSVGNAEDVNLDSIGFFAINQPDDEFSFDLAFSFQGDNDLNVISPNAVDDDGIVSDELLAVGEIPTFENGQLAVAAFSPSDPSPGLGDALSNAEILIGFDGQFEGDPATATTREELMAMFNGRVLQANLPDRINLGDRYIVSSSVPEPSAATLMGAAAGAAAAGAARRRRR